MAFVLQRFLFMKAFCYEPLSLSSWLLFVHSWIRFEQTLLYLLDLLLLPQRRRRRNVWRNENREKESVQRKNWWLVILLASVANQFRHIHREIWINCQGQEKDRWHDTIVKKTGGKESEKWQTTVLRGLRVITSPLEKWSQFLPGEAFACPFKYSYLTMIVFEWYHSQLSFFFFFPFSILLVRILSVILVSSPFSLLSSLKTLFSFLSPCSFLFAKSKLIHTSAFPVIQSPKTLRIL